MGDKVEGIFCRVLTSCISQHFLCLQGTWISPAEISKWFTCLGVILQRRSSLICHHGEHGLRASFSPTELITREGHHLASRNNALHTISLCLTAELKQNQKGPPGLCLVYCPLLQLVCCHFLVGTKQAFPNWTHLHHRR